MFGNGVDLLTLALSLIERHAKGTRCGRTQGGMSRRKGEVERAGDRIETQKRQITVDAGTTRYNIVITSSWSCFYRRFVYTRSCKA